MAATKPQHKWKKITLIILAVLVLLLLAASLIITLAGPGIIKSKINDGLAKGTDSVYRVEFKDASINIFQGRITLSDVHLIADTNRFKSLRNSKQSPASLFTFHADQVVLSNMHPFKLWLSKKLHVGLIQLQSPVIGFASYPSSQTQKPKSNQTIYQKISKTFNEVRVDKIRIKDAQANYTDFKATRPAPSGFKELDVDIDDVLIDATSEQDKRRMLFCRNIDLKLHNYKGKSPTGLYAYRTALIRFSTQTGILQFDSLSFSPLLSPQEFFPKTHSDRFSIWTKSIKLHQFDWDNYRKKQRITASKVELNGGYIGVFSNPRFNPQGINQDKASTFPNQILRTLPIAVNIDSISIQHYNVNYREYNRSTKQTGTLDFSEVNGRMLHVSNDSASLIKNPKCYVQLQTRFMKKSAFNVAFTFNLRDSLYAYDYKGSLEPIDMTALNPATVPLASVRIKSGRLKKLSFAIRANRNISKGQVRLLYNDLKVELLKADTAKGTMKKKLLMSLAANTFFLKSNNPDNAQQPPRVGEVNYLRPKNYPFFKTLWRALFMGLKPSVGFKMNNKPDADTKKAQKDKKRDLKKYLKSERKRQKHLRKKGSAL